MYPVDGPRHGPRPHPTQETPVARSRLLLPALLGATAAFGNYMILTKSTATTALIALRVDKKPGDPLEEADFEPVPARGDPALYAATVPYADRASVYGKSLRRKVAKGELVFRADVEATGQLEPPPPRYRSLTLIARASVVAGRVPGEYVDIFVRPTGHSGNPNNPRPVARYGPYRYLGSMADPSPGNRDGQIVQFAAAVPTHPQGEEVARIAALGEVQAARSYEAVVQVEVVRGTPP